MNKELLQKIAISLSNKFYLGGTLAGAGLGAGIGALTNKKNRGKGALTGAVAGAPLGLIGGVAARNIADNRAWEKLKDANKEMDLAKRFGNQEQMSDRITKTKNALDNAAKYLSK